MNKIKQLFCLLLFVPALVQAAVARSNSSNAISYAYDLNNNPKQIYFMNGSVTKYVYSASGQKLRAVHYTAKPNISRTWGVKPAELTSSQILQADSTDYLLGGKLTMKNGKVDKYIFDGGYAQASVASSTSDNFTFYYYTPDHLGNIREVVNASGSVQQVTNYYPFGATYAESTAADFQPYKYNGKELDKMHGLNTYDYGARQHDPILARWDRIDPLAEKYRGISPYVYCTNSPIKLLDQQGKEPTPYEAALMAKHVYEDKVNLAGGWHLSKTQYKSFNTESGLQSALYERTAKGVKEYAYVTAGTQDITDAKEDINQLFGVGTQYRESVNNAKILSNNLVNSELTFVGHSLGGGLAAANALATDRNAITINAAAISKSTKDNLQLPSSTSKGRIFNIVVKGEIVGYLQTKLGMKLEGGAYTLNAIYLPGNSIINTVLRINNHLIDTVIRKLEGERK